ncbi:MAG: hypothetical protein NVS2B3_01810 [Vulcanimicrobiaceae bacterium]
MRAVTISRLGSLVLVCASALASPGASAATVGDREIALHAISDMKAATDSIVRTEDGNAVGRAAYRTAALEARNALVGRSDRDFSAHVRNPGDDVGAIGYVDRLLDRASTARWTDGLRGAKINLLAAAQSLTDATHAKQMEEYQTDLTAAIADISLALGRPSQDGVLGGIEGALATTVLGVPAGARVVPGCSAPTVAPAYGVSAGRLSYVAVDRRAAAIAVPADFPVRRIAVSGDRLVLYPTSLAEAARACGRPPVATVRSHRRERTRAVASASLVSYTAGQARAGAVVYAQNCLSCHGAKLQGVAGPAVAGKEFLTQVSGNGWSVADLRNLVVQQMPLNNPGALTPKQYADVMAYLLAANCFSAGSAPFPLNDDPRLAKIKIRAPHGTTPTADVRLGTCRVR